MDCLFCKISKNEIESAKVYEDDEVFAFRDINPKAPTHILIIPKKHQSSINEIEEDDNLLMGKLIIVAKKIAIDEGINESGYRLVFNTGPDAGQEVKHVHLHLLGGRGLNWPPG